MKRVIIVAVTDEIKSIAALTLPKMQAYAKRCNAELIVLRGLPEKYQHPKYRMFEASDKDADRYLIVDADILIRDSAPNIFEAFPQGNWMFDEGAMRGLNMFAQQKREVCEYADDEIDFGACWWNPGVSLLDRDAVMSIYQMPPWDVREELFTVADGSKITKNMPWTNYQIAKHGIQINALPIEWNCFVNSRNNLQAAHFWHCAGSEINRNAIQVKEGIIRKMIRNYEPKQAMGTHVHFVIGDNQQGWTLGRLVSEMKQRYPQGIECTSGEYVVEGDEAVNVFVPYRAWHLNACKAKSIVLFTHPGDLDKWNAAMQCDAAIAMNEQYRQALIDNGMDAAKVHRINYGIDEVYRDCRLRIFHPGRMVATDEYMGRKGWSDWQRLMECDWLVCKRSEGLLSQEQMMDEYLKADVIVSTATMEGGPMSCIEALALGRPYIGRQGVGLHDEYADVILRYKDYDGLFCMLFEKYKAKEKRNRQVILNSWAVCAAYVWKVIGDTIGKEMVCGDGSVAVEAVEEMQSKAVVQPKRYRLVSLRADRR
jgi:hypothetical protein